MWSGRQGDAQRVLTPSPYHKTHLFLSWEHHSHGGNVLPKEKEWLPVALRLNVTCLGAGGGRSFKSGCLKVNENIQSKLDKQRYLHQQGGIGRAIYPSIFKGTWPANLPGLWPLLCISQALWHRSFLTSTISGFIMIFFIRKGLLQEYGMWWKFTSWGIDRT